MEKTLEQSELQQLEKKVALLEEHNTELIERIKELSLRDREKKGLIRSLFDNLPYGVVMFDGNRNIVQINQAAALILGFDKQRLIGRNCSDVLSCYERNLGCPVLDGGQSLEQVRTGCFECGKTLLRSAVQNKGAGGVIIVETFGDISELEKATVAKTMALQTKSNFLSNISHELRTPMHGILGFAELLSLESSSMSEQSQSNIEHMCSSADRLWKLIEKLIQAARLEEHSLELHVSKINFTEFISDFEKEAQHINNVNSNSLTFDIDASIGYISCDVLKLHQILIGLIENAMKYTENGVINVSIKTLTEADKSYLKVEVKDNGIGISEKKQSEIFNLFEQEDGTGSRPYQGAGLGLAIVKQLAMLMGGDITLQSQQGKGSCFNLSLPV